MFKVVQVNGQNQFIIGKKQYFIFFPLMMLTFISSFFVLDYEICNNFQY